MIAGAIGVSVLLVSVAIAVWTTWYLRRDRATLPAELEDRRQAIRGRLDALAEAIPAAPDILETQFPQHERTAAAIAKLLGDSPRGALAEAELVLADMAGDAKAHLLLARACLAANELEACEQQVGRARELGDESPMRSFLEARLLVLRHLRELHVDNAEIQDSPLPSMVTPVEMLLLSLEKQRRSGDSGSGVWAPGVGQVSDQEIADMVAAHFGIYYSALEHLLDAAREAPGFSDALYHIARMALKVGFAERGRALMEAIGPLMESSPDHREFERDLGQIRGEEPAIVAPLPKLTGTAKRSDKLRVL